MMDLKAHLEDIERNPVRNVIESLPRGSKLYQLAHAQYEADAQALADVRTLDDWRALSPERNWHMSGDGWAWCRLIDHASHAYTRGYDAATPEAARAKAAAWVREQAKGAK